jgi:LPXTG-site transpeptidase (sortase) family protein
MNNSTPSLSRIVVGMIIVCAAIVIFYVFEGRLHSSREPVATLTPVASVVPPQAAAAPSTTPNPTMRILAPKADLAAQIIHVYVGSNDTWDISQLDRNAGYLEGTPPIGFGGNVVLVGHVEMKDGSAGPFAHLDKLVVGDPISIIVAPNTLPLEYTVTDKRTVQPDDVDQIRNHGYEEITLVTCGNYDFKSNTYQTRLVIHARPVKRVPRVKMQG